MLKAVMKTLDKMKFVTYKTSMTITQWYMVHQKKEMQLS